MVKIGVLADTHVKDRVRFLHPQVVPIFREAGVSLILHAGDVSSTLVIDELSSLAPVQAVQGNADWLMGCHFPMTFQIEVEGLNIWMTHGQGSLIKYVRDRFNSALFGLPQFRYFEDQVQMMMPVGTDIVIFGHIHAVINRYQNGHLLFNPGSASLPISKDRSPSVGILTIDEGKVTAEIVTMEELQKNDLAPVMRTVVELGNRFHKRAPGLDRH